MLSWLPAPLPGQGAPRVPPTVERVVPVPSSAAMPTHGARPMLDGFRTMKRASTRPVVSCAPIRFTAIGVAWTQRGTATVSALISVGPAATRLGPATEVESALDEGPDVDSGEYQPGRRATDLLWVGNLVGARCARFRLTVHAGSEVSDLRLVFLNTSGTAFGGKPDTAEAAPAGPSGHASVPFGPRAAEAMAWRPGIVTRSQWGAKEALRNCGPNYAAEVQIGFVHHTANSNVYARWETDDVLRGIYRYHTNTLGWCDIAYNFLVDRYGRIFEGRAGGMGRPVIPAATMGFNTESTAVAAIGNFQYASPPDAMVSAVQTLLTWRLDLAHVSPLSKVWRRSGGSTGGKYPAGTWVRLPAIASHRDAGFTDCPGDYLYWRLPAIRTAVSLRGLPKIFSPWQSSERLVPTLGTVSWRATGSAHLRWTLQVRDEAGTVVRSWTGEGGTFSAIWDGATEVGLPAPPGTYTVTLLGRDGAKKARPARFPLAVDPVPEPTPSPSSTPSPGPEPTSTPTPTETPPPGEG